MIETIGTNDSFVFAGPVFGSFIGLTPGFVAGSALNFVAGPALGSVAGSAPGSINDSTLGSVTVPVSGAVASRIASKVINPKTTFFYGKEVTAEDYTSSKFYMKGTIRIEGIPFGKTKDVWNYMLGIPNKI